MNFRQLACGILIAVSCGGQTLDAPRFHHLHLNSTNPEAAIDFYVKQFVTVTKTTFAGAPALKAGDVLVLFNKVNQPPPSSPQTSMWHFGWHVTDVRAKLAEYQRTKVHLLPLYTGEGDGSVFVSSDTYPGTGGVLGLTKAQIDEAKANGVKPAGGAGFAYMAGPDGAVIEYQGNMPRERFNHVHMYWEDPFCAQLWYYNVLQAKIPGPTGKPARTQATCEAPRGADKTWPALEKEGMYRTPGANVAFSSPDDDDPVTLNSYIRQGGKPFGDTRGHLQDHVGLSVTNLNAWLVKLRAERVKFLGAPYTVDSHPAVMIEGPSKEAIELIQVK